MFGRRRRRAAAKAASESARAQLQAQLARRPDHICPFLGLADDRGGYLDGVSDEHRCFAFGDAAPLSAETQTRVCQQRGYGNCPRYLRGVLVIPTGELDALRAGPTARAATAAPARRRGRRAFPVVLAVLVLLLLGIAGTGAAYIAMRGLPLVGASEPTPTPRETPRPTRTPAPSPSATPQATAEPSVLPTPVAGDEFAYYEVTVTAGSYTVFRPGDSVAASARQSVTFDSSSYARVEPRDSGDGRTWWVTEEGDLRGWAYIAPESGDFGIRAIYTGSDGTRRSTTLSDAEISRAPASTPAPIP